LPVEETVAGQVWKNQSVVYIEDLGSDTRNELGLRWLRTNELRSYCVLPLTTFHKGLGALGFGSRRDHSFDAHDLIFLRRASQFGEKMSPQGLVPPGQHFGRRNLPQA